MVPQAQFQTCSSLYVQTIIGLSQRRSTASRTMSRSPVLDFRSPMLPSLYPGIDPAHRCLCRSQTTQSTVPSCQRPQPSILDLLTASLLTSSP
ncbi:hypothetical protein M0R45_019521 [Rubus argutus]|uniref:Uncharacterized protein n=1 Tax=Rubus argutus TaxID=59490 RepID=A0AAW1X784_RUBAR